MVLIDFGDHLPSQLLVKSPHADQIGKLISGYIDLLLKAPQEAAQTGLPDEFFQGDEEMMENVVSFSATGVTTTTTAGYFRGPNNTIYHPPSQRVNVANVTSAQKACSLLSDELGSTKGFAWVNPSELTLENAKIQFNSDKRAFASAVDDLLGTAKFNPSGLRRRDVDLKAQQLAAQVKGIAARARSIAAFDDTPSLYGAKAVAEAISNMFTFLDNATAKPENFPPMAEFIFGLEQAEKAIHRAQLLLEDSNKIFIVDEGACLMMLDYVKEMDMSFQYMINAGKVAAESLSVETRSEFENAMKHCQIGKDWLLGSMSQLIPVISDPNILQAAQGVQADIETMADYLLEMAKKAGVDPRLLQASRDAIHDFGKEIFQAANLAERKGLEGNVDFATPATLLTCALSDLRTALQEPASLMDLSQPEIIPGPNVVQTEKLNNFITEEMEKLKKHGNQGTLDTNEFENQMNTLRESVAKQAVSPTTLRSDPLSIFITTCSSALTSLSVAVDVVTDAVDDQSQDRFKKAKTNLNEDFSLLEQYTEELRDNPTSAIYLGRVANTVGRLEALTQQLVTDAGETSAQSDLRFNAKVAIAKAKALMMQAARCEASVWEPKLKSDMQNVIKTVNSGMPGLLIALQNASTQPDNFDAQMDLLTQAQWITQQFANMTNTASQYAPYVQNDAYREGMLEAIDKMYVTNTALWKSCNAVAAISGEAQIEAAMEDIEAIKVDLDTAAFAAGQGLLKAIPGQTRDEALEIVQNSSAALTKNLSDLSKASKEGHPVSTYCTLVASCATEMGTLAQGTRMLASTVVDREQQKRIIGAGKEVHDKALNVISIARVIASNYQYQSDPKKLNNLDTSNTAYQVAVQKLLESPEGLQTGNVDDAVNAINKALECIINPKPPAGRPQKIGEAIHSLVSDAKALSAAVAQFTAIALKNPVALGSAAKMTGLTTAQLVSSCGDVVWASDPSTKQIIASATKNLAEKTKTLLITSKDVALEKSKQNVDKLKSSEADVKDAISELLRSLGVPSSQTSEESISSINAFLSLLNEEEGDDILAMSLRELYDAFAAAFQSVAGVSAELAKASGSNANTFPLGILSKDAMAAVEATIEPSRVASKMAHKWTPVEIKLLQDVRMIQEDPVNTKEVANLTKSILNGVELLKVDAEKFISANPKDPHVEAIKQAEKQLTSATQNLLAATKAQGPDRNVANIVETAKITGQRVKTLALLTKDKTAHDVLTTQFAEQLKEATRAATIAITGQLRAAAAVVTYEDTQTTAKELERATNTVASTLNDLIQLTGALNPGVAACDAATKATQNASSLLDSALIGLNFDGKFDPGAPVNRPLVHYQGSTVKILKDLADNVQRMAVKAKGGDPEGLAQEAVGVEKQVPLFVKMALLTAAATSEKEDQVNMLEMSKNLTDTMVKLLGATKSLNIHDDKSVAKLDKLVATTNDVIGELLNELQSGAQIVTECETATATIKAHMIKLSDTNPPPTTKKYVQCRVDLNNATKNLLAQGKRLLITDKTKGGEVGMILLATVEASEKLVVAANETMATTHDVQAKKAIKSASTNTLTELTKMISLTAQTIQGQDNTGKINAAFKVLNANVAEVYSAAQRGDVAERSLEKASKIISDTIQQISTSEMFAQTGNIEISDPEFTRMTPQQLQVKLQNSTKQLEAEAVVLVQTTTNGTDEQYGAAAVKLADLTANMGIQATWSAAKLEDQMSSMELLTAAKGLSSKLHKLLSSVKDARDKPDDTTKQKIMISAEDGFKSMIGELVQAGHHTGGGSGMAKAEKELELSKQSIIALLGDIPVYDTVVAEDLVKASREVLSLTAQLRFASTQDEIIEAGKKASAGTEKLVKVANTVSVKLAPDPATGQKILDAAKKGATTMVNLLEASKLSRQAPNAHEKIEQASETVTVSITELVALLKLLPDTADLQLEGEDLEKKAEEELKKCTQLLEKSKHGLEEAKKKLQADTSGDKVSIDINTALLTATAAIADATQKLVATAEAAQIERCNGSVVHKRTIKYNADPTWANGLMSATAQVSSAIQHLVKSANEAVEGKGQEALVASTRNIAQATAHLVQASKAKSNPTVASKLNAAAKLVANATAKLVEASNRANEMKNLSKEDDLSNLAATDESRVHELEQQMRILKLENDLEKAKRQLARLKKRNN